MSRAVNKILSQFRCLFDNYIIAKLFLCIWGCMFKLYLMFFVLLIAVTALNWVTERLEALARQCTLKFSNYGGTEVNLSADMFLIQVFLEVSGRVKDVRITHSGDPQPERCPELAESLNNGNFNEFHSHLRGLISMYQVGAIDK